MSVKTLEILEQLKSLTLVETSELVKQIEVTFGVDTSSKNWVSVQPIDEKDSSDQPEPVKTDFDVVLEEVPVDKKIAILKVVRILTGLALKEAKDFVESTPKVVREAIAIEAAEDIKQQLEVVGAKVFLQ